jgi:hypothetical protein
MKKSISISFLLSFFLFTGCNNPVVNIQPKQASPTVAPTSAFNNMVGPDGGIDPNFGKITVSGKVTDALTGELINSELKVSITGNDSSSADLSTLSNKDGIVAFDLKNGLKPATDKTMKINIVVNADGYFPMSVPITLSGTFTPFDVKMISLKANLKGVAYAETNSIVDSSGKITEAITLQAEDKQNHVKTFFTLPGDTILKDKDGNILTGKLKVNMGSFNNQKDENINAFPGGINSTVLVDGKKENTFFSPATFASVELTDESGKKAATFSKPMNISMEVAKGTINPESGSEIKNGDSIGIYSNNINDGQWTKEGAGNVTGPDQNGNFKLNYNVNHLSYWDLGWDYYAPNGVCNTKLKFIWNNSQPHYPVDIRFKLPEQSFGATNVLYDEVNYVDSLPRHRHLLIVAYLYGGEIGRMTTELDDCSEVRLNLDSNKVPQLVKIPVKVDINYMGTRIRPSFPFYYRNLTRKDDYNYYKWQSGFLYFGNATISVLEGDTYEFKGVYRNKPYSKTVVISKGLREILINDIASVTLGYPFAANTPVPVPSLAPVVNSQPGEIYNNTNTAGVNNNPTKPVTFSVSEPFKITEIYTYHWNFSGNSNTGTHLLRSNNGKTYGPFQTGGSDGQNGKKNVNWTSHPNVIIPAGSYTLEDSDNATWSTNAQSYNAGFARISGFQVK